MPISITEKMIRIDNRLMRKGRTYDPSIDWFDNAVASHGFNPFHAVIALRNPLGASYVLEGDDVDDTHVLMIEKRSDDVVRSPEEMARVAEPLLVISKRIIFVDPHFRPTSHKFRLPLEKFLECIVNDNTSVQSVEYHTGDGKRNSYDSGTAYIDFMNDCEQHLPHCVPRGINMKIVRWCQPCLHNRYILTERGVLEFGTGLDMATGTGVQNDSVSLLDEDVRQELWNDYMGLSTRLKPSGDPSPVTIIGQR